jgi:hypothetical protein
MNKATVEKVLKTLTTEKRDVRKADWTNKEVGSYYPLSLIFHNMKEHHARYHCLSRIKHPLIASSFEGWACLTFITIFPR